MIEAVENVGQRPVASIWQGHPVTQLDAAIRPVDALDIGPRKAARG